MSDIFDLYGFKNDKIDFARKRVEQALQIQFQTREGEYEGGLYYLYREKEVGTFSIKLKCNIDPYDHLPVESKFPDYPLLLYVDYPPDPDDIKKTLTESIKEISFLRRNVK